MAFELNPVAVTGAALLRAIHSGGWASKAELAESVGKAPNNISRDLGVLDKAGLIIQPAEPVGAILLSDDGIAQLAALDRANGEGVSNGAPLQADELLLTHGQMEPDPDNPRTDLISDAATDTIDELRESIIQRGLLQNLTVRPKPENEGVWYVTGGNRRWYAIQQAIFDGDWPEDRTIRVKLRDEDAREALLTAIVENKQRQDMPPIDEAFAFARLRDQFGMTTSDIAAESSLDLRVVQNRLRLLKLSEEDQERMRLPEDHEEHLTQKAALRAMATPREPGSPQTLGQQVAALGTATMATGTVQSSPPATPTFESGLTNRQALLLIELAHKADVSPDPEWGSEYYTQVHRDALNSDAAGLISRKLIATRIKGDHLLMRPVLFSTGYKDWLTSLDFYVAGCRGDVLFEARARVFGMDDARRLDLMNRFATSWLNPPFVNEEAAPAPQPSAVTPKALPPTEPSAPEPQQPDLIQPTLEELEARRAVEFEREAAQQSSNAMAVIADEAQTWMAFARYRNVDDHLNDYTPKTGLALVDSLLKALAVGALPEAAAVLAAMRREAGRGKAFQALREISPKAIAETITLARDIEAADAELAAEAKAGSE